MRRYRVWTKNRGDTYSVMNDWTSHGRCRAFIIGRWGHWPPWAFISQVQDTEAFIRYNGK